ncbi:MAG: glycosyltransferase family 4 protein [Anaerolineales bacterium]
MTNKFPGKVALIQRVLPAYRAPFFNMLGMACKGGLHIFAGDPQPDEMIKTTQHLVKAKLTHGRNVHLFKGKYYLCLQIGLLSWLKTVDPDVLIVEANPRYIYTSAVRRWMQKRHRAVIGWGLGATSPTGPLSTIRQLRRKQFINAFDAMITYSQQGAIEYAALRFPKERIFIAVNAVTPKPRHPLPERKPAGDTVRILFVGRLQERKNLDNLLLACSQLEDPLQPELVIVGDGPARQELETLAKQIYPETHFPGALYGDDLEAQYRAADLFVLPGTGGLAIQQAMSFGLPIIAAQADGTQQDLVRPSNGWIIPPNELSALKTALIRALSDLKNLRRMGAESYRIVSNEINLEQMVAVFIDALNRTYK